MASFPGGHPALQFLGPVVHHYDLRKGCVLRARLDHQKSLADGQYLCAR